MAPVFCQSDKLIPPKKQLKDLEKVWEVVEAHPDPFTHVSEELFKSVYDSIKAACIEPVSQAEFYKRVSRLISLIKDGHTSVVMPRDWLKELRESNGGFPYDMYLDNEDKLYIEKNNHQGSIKPGSRILSINEMPVDSFLRTIDPWISYERKPFRNTIIDDRFEFYLYLVFGRSDSLKFTFVLQDKQSVIIRNIPYKEWKKTEKATRTDSEIQEDKGEPYSYEKIDDGVGLLHIYSFSVPDLAYYDLFLSRTFTRIKKDNIHSLIIDIRGNFGGWPKVSSRLFHKLTDKRFKTMAVSHMKVSKAYRHYFLERNPNRRFNKTNYRQLSAAHQIDISALINNKVGSFVTEEEVFNEDPSQESDEFRGDLYLLTNRDSYSAASSFASTFECYQMGIIIGEETGGTKIFRANAMFEQLENSKLIVRISTTKLLTTCFDKEFEGVRPTINYIPTIHELTSGMDTQLMFAKKVIKKMQAQKKKGKN